MIKNNKNKFLREEYNKGEQNTRKRNGGRKRRIIENQERVDRTIEKHGEKERPSRKK